MYSKNDGIGRKSPPAALLELQPSPSTAETNPQRNIDIQARKDERNKRSVVTKAARDARATARKTETE